MVIVFDTEKLEKKRQFDNLSMRKLSLMLSSREAFYRELVSIRHGEVSSIFNACQLVCWYNSIDCIVYCRPQVMRILKRALVNGVQSLNFSMINEKLASDPHVYHVESEPAGKGACVNG